VDGLNQINNLVVGGGQVGKAGGQVAGGSQAGSGEGQVSFKDVLLKNLNEVNQLQEDADQKLQDYVTGKTQNMGEVISASQKASMAFSMLTQIRNKLQDAYDEVKNLRI
jgi:flagellar hook-basal body complex protein FliE